MIFAFSHQARTPLSRLDSSALLSMTMREDGLSSHPLSSLLVEGCPCGADLSSAFGAPLLQGSTLLACKNAICKKNQYSPKYKNTASLTFPFPPAAEANLRPFGPPPSSGRRERCESPPFLKEGTKKTQPMRAALSDFKNYTLKRK